MEEILQNIAKINTAAVEIMDAAAKQKAAQDTEMAARTKAFDEQMEADTAEKIAALQSSLQQKLEEIGRAHV